MANRKYGMTRVGQAILVAVVALAGVIPAGCTYYRDPRAEVIITANRDGAIAYLVPADKAMPKNPTEAALKEYAMGVASPDRSVWVPHGRYWLVLRKDGVWSNPVDFEVRIDYLNKVHVEF